MYSNLAVVICHGLYHTPALYGPLMNVLRSSGIETYCPQLPTSDLTKLNVGDIAHPVFDLDPPGGGYPQGKEEAEVVRQVLKDLLDQGKDVLLLAHSAGGWVATETAVPEFQAKVRKEQGLPGG
jgi:alpha-beta hydrolase superfamily lysophospholipase